MRIIIPKLRTWHLLGIVAASAAFFSVMQFRWSVEDDGYALIRRLRALDAGERAKAADELTEIRPRERRAIAPLTEMLFDSDARARASAARALLHIVGDDEDESVTGPVKAALASALHDPDPVARREIARCLAALGAEPKVIVPILLELAGDRDPRTWSEAISILGMYGRKSEPALAALFAGLVDPDFEIRSWSVRSLGYCAVIPDVAPEPLLGRIKAKLIRAADDENPRVRGGAARALGYLASSSRTEIPRVIEALNDPDAGVRCTAANYLCWNRFGKRSPALIPALVRTLADTDTRVRLMSTRTLSTLGPEAEAALPSLRALANDPEKEVGDQAAEAIKTIEKFVREFRTVTLPEAIADLGDADPSVRSLAASRLEDLGPKAAGAVPSLVRCLADREAEVRRAAARALGQFGPEAAVAVPALANLAESDPDERVRQAANLSRLSLLSNGGGKDHTP